MAAPHSKDPEKVGTSSRNCTCFLSVNTETPAEGERALVVADNSIPVEDRAFMGMLCEPRWAYELICCSHRHKETESISHQVWQDFNVAASFSSGDTLSSSRERRRVHGKED